MKKLVSKFGKYNVAVFGIMGVGVILFLLTPLLIWLFDFDSDIIRVSSLSNRTGNVRDRACCQAYH